LSDAYDVPVNPSPRLSTLLGWTFRERYDIEAKAPAGAISRPSGQRSTKPNSTNDPRIACRPFQTRDAVENKTMSVYALAIASGGPKLQKQAIAAKDCTIIGSASDRRGVCNRA